jgi:cystathionine gamma-synthase
MIKIRNIAITSRRVYSTISPSDAGQQAEDIAKRQVAQKRSIETLLAHSGLNDSHNIENAPMSPPIHLATTYTRPASGIYNYGDLKYSRMDNPTRVLLEREMSRLECIGSHDDDADVRDENLCCAFASGMMAVSSIVLSHASPVTVLIPNDMYHGVPTVLMDVLQRFGVTTERVDMLNLVSVKDAVLKHNNNTDTIVWMETPSNPLLQILDVRKICDIVNSLDDRSRITTVVDSTLAPPTIAQPLVHGADLCLHAATKGLAGHSDALLGVVTASPWTARGRALSPRLRATQIAMGGVASGMDSWLTIRGLRTLYVRVDRQCMTAMKVASFLEKQPRVKAVYYPGLDSHPQHAVAKNQMKGGFGSVFSVEMETESEAMALAGALRIVLRATSLGGTETMIEHRASIEPDDRRTSPPGLCRVSVGLEAADELIADFEQALAIAKSVCS